MSNNYFKKSELRQPVPEAHSPKKLAQMKTTTEEEVYGAVNMTADKSVECQVRLSYAETAATTWSMADTDRFVSQLEREIYGIVSNEQMRFKKEFCIRLIECEVRRQPICIHELQKTTEQRVIHFGYPKMHLVSHISEAIWRMGSSDNFTTDISERLHIGNVTEAYRSTNKVNYNRHTLMHNDRSTGRDYMEETLSYLALQGWYDIDSAKVFNLLSAADNQYNTCRAHLLRLQHCQD
jgi:hypothetical protein